MLLRAPPPIARGRAQGAECAGPCGLGLGDTPTARIVCGIDRDPRHVTGQPRSLAPTADSAVGPLRPIVIRVSWCTRRRPSQRKTIAGRQTRLREAAAVPIGAQTFWLRDGMAEERDTRGVGDSR